MAKTLSRARGRARVSGFVGARRRGVSRGRRRRVRRGRPLAARSTIFSDDVAMRAAREGSAAGFYGRTVYVRSAGEEAWLGREAPENPAFDASDAPNDGNSNIGLGLSGVFYADDADGSAPPVHARSLAHAMEIARDGDRVLFLRGVHNGLGVTADVRRRISDSRRGRAPRGDVGRARQLARVSNPSLVRDSKRGDRLHRVLRGDSRRGRRARETSRRTLRGDVLGRRRRGDRGRRRAHVQRLRDRRETVGSSNRGSIRPGIRRLSPPFVDANGPSRARRLRADAAKLPRGE